MVDSSQQGLMQHDGFSWAVKGPGFVRLHSVTRQAQLCDQELRSWVQGLSETQREQFIDSAFQVLEASGAKTLTDLKADSFKAVGAIVRALKDLDKGNAGRPAEIYEHPLPQQSPYDAGGLAGGNGKDPAGQDSARNSRQGKTEQKPPRFSKENRGGFCLRKQKSRSPTGNRDP